MFRCIALALLGFLVCWSCARSIDIHIQSCLHKTEDKPKLKLPWGTWEGELYRDEIILFRNVRYGQAPVGKLRFAAPKYPDAKSNQYEIQDSSFGPSCIGVNPLDKVNVSTDPLATGAESEDCLFLDVYVPAWMFDPEIEFKLPVAVWFYGGAYIFGGKNVSGPGEDGQTINLYDGRNIIESASQNLIWVVGNYRMGAYGFLAGSTMESNAKPNAGLHDQRLILDWVQRYVGQVGGNKSEVTVMGSSAGAGSIMHHLTAYGGKKNENLFQQAALFSTAFQWSYDRAGTLEETFNKFTKEAGCSGSGSNAINCLQGLKSNSEALVKANKKIITDSLAVGLFPFGPAVDGDLVPDLPAVLLKKGQKVKVDAFILSHTLDEASKFLAKWVKTKADVTKFLAMAFPGSKLQSTRDKIEKQYKDEDYDGEQELRMMQILKDSTFVCNKHQISKAYKDTAVVYAARYGIVPATHGQDLFHLVWSPDLDMKKIFEAVLPDSDLKKSLIELLPSLWSHTSNIYQKYIAGFIIGNINTFAPSPRLKIPYWSRLDDRDEDSVYPTMMVQLYPGEFFKLGRDYQATNEVCNFWQDIAEEISKASTKGVELDHLPGLVEQSVELK